MYTFQVFSAPEVQMRILRSVFRLGQTTRQALSDELGYSLLTVSKAVTALLDEGVMIADGTVSSQAGRRRDVLKLNPRYRMCLCADIGYGGVKLALVDLAGQVVRKTMLPPLNNPIRDGIPFEAMLRMMNMLIDEAGKERILGIGVGISGMVAFEEGRVLFCPNISGFDNRPLAEELNREFSLPVLVDTSARCMAKGEQRFGAGTGIKDQICLSLGLGSIAAGIMLDGKLYRGSSGYAGEIGHTCVRPGKSEHRCSCGGYDCLELYATLQMLCSNIQSALDACNGNSPAREMLSGEKLSVYRMREALETGDPIVEDYFERAIDDIAAVLVGVVNLFAPQQVVVGGGFPACFPEAVGQLEKKVLAACLPPLRSDIRLVPSKLSDEASLRGAAAMLIEQFFQEE